MNKETARIDAWMDRHAAQLRDGLPEESLTLSGSEAFVVCNMAMIGFFTLMASDPDGDFPDAKSAAEVLVGRIRQSGADCGQSDPIGQFCMSFGSLWNADRFNKYVV